jgi:hypothetical protein
VQIGLAACRVGQSLRLGGILEKLGRKHVDYGATLETYGVVKDAFMWVIDKALGESSRLAGLDLFGCFGCNLPVTENLHVVLLGFWLRDRRYLLHIY